MADLMVSAVPTVDAFLDRCQQLLQVDAPTMVKRMEGLGINALNRSLRRSVYAA